MSFLGGIGMQFLGGMLSGNAERKRQARLLALQRQRHFDAYALATQETPEAIKYRNRLLDRATEGDPDIGKRQRMMMSPIMQQGQVSRSTAQGQAIKQGLENSIIAHEIRSKVDHKTLQAITTMAEKIAMYNDQYKKTYEDKLDSYHLQRSQKLQTLATQYMANQPIDTGTTSGEMMSSLFGQIMSGVSSQFFKGSAGQASIDNWFKGVQF